jgi:modulator of FtsH protease HflK
VAEGAAARLSQDAQAYAAQVVALAEGQSSRFSALAAAYDQSPEVTRKRLYLDTIESVLSRANKVIVDDGGKGGSGNMMYLPLDKLLDRARTQQNPDSQDQQSNQRVTPESESQNLDGRARGER